MNLFDHINGRGDCERFEPQPCEDFSMTSAPPGSAEKLEILRLRAEAGQPLWHNEDRTDFAGCRQIILSQRRRSRCAGE